MYVSLALVAVTAVLVLINLFKGLIRGFKKTIGTLIAIIISAVIAFVATMFICDPGAPIMASITSMIEGLLTQAELQEVLEIEELGESVLYYASMLASPFVFFSLYTVISIIVSIIVGILVKIIPPFKLKKGLLHRLGGAAVGAVCGLLVALLVLMPVVGVIDIAVALGETDIITPQEGEDDTLSQLLNEASEDEIYAAYVLYAGWVFDSLASAEYEGQKIYLKDEVTVLASLISDIGEISGEATEFGRTQVDAMGRVVDDIDHSPLLNNTLAGVLSAMATKWLAGETFLGIESIKAGELFDPVIHSVLEVIASSGKENITADMRTLVHILEVMVDYDLLKNFENFDKILEILSAVPENEGEKTAIEALISVANENPRMSKLADEVTRLSIRALASNLGIPESGDVNYELLMNDIADALNSTKGDADRIASVEEKVVVALDTYGVEVGGEAALDIAGSIVSDLGDLDSVNAEAVKEFFMMYAIAKQSEESASTRYSGFDKLSGDMSVTVDPATGTVKVGDYEFKYYNSSYTRSAAYSAGASGVNFDDAQTLYSADSMKSKIVTLEDIFNAEGVKRFSELSAEEIEAEAKKMSDMIALSLNAVGGDLSNIDYNSMIKEIGVVFDQMSDMQIFGDEATAKLVEALFQSEQIINSLGISKSVLEDYAQKIIGSARAETNSYDSVTKSVGGMLDMMSHAGNGDVSKEDKIETTKQLMQDLTVENAELLGSMATPEMVKDYVANEEYAESISGSISSLFNNMVTIGHEDEEKYEKEADAVNTMLNLAIEGSSSSSSSIFSEKDESGSVVNQGRMDTDAAGFVELVVSSSVVSKTIEDTVSNDQTNPLGIIPSEQDTAALTQALTDHYDAAKTELSDEELAELASTLGNIALIANIDVPEFN